uniref:Uncharacterized protein n=1 Tax=Octopus bimaculoides TaxID=37653 RepID=A0A0L8FZ87_OCTBM
MEFLRESHLSYASTSQRSMERVSSMNLMNSSTFSECHVSHINSNSFMSHLICIYIR